MVAILFSAILLVLLLVVGMLERFYATTPLSELRRNARRGDAQASLIHEVARNGTYAKVYLYCLAWVLFAVLVAVMSGIFTSFELIIAMCVVAILWFGVRAQARRIAPLAVKIAPTFAVIIVGSRPYVKVIKKLFGFMAPRSSVGQLYEKDDLVTLIEQQRSAAHNRIDKAELDVALHALTFSEKRVKDHMTPRKVVRFVATDEPVSPILMDELYQTGFSRFPVYLDDIDNIVGTLYLKSLVERKMSGKVFSAMSTDVYDVKEDENLEAVLEKFLRTKHHLFIVKNQFAEVVGIITIEDVIEQILGRKIVDEFDVHEDMRQFAEKQATTA